MHGFVVFTFCGYGNVKIFFFSLGDNPFFSVLLVVNNKYNNQKA